MKYLPLNQVEFKSTNELDFNARPWHLDPTLTEFKIGTCEGIFKVEKLSYDIVAVINNLSGNGHFQDVLDWLYNSCKRDKRNLRFLEIINKSFAKHLKEKRLFKITDSTAELSYTKM